MELRQQFRSVAIRLPRLHPDKAAVPAIAQNCAERVCALRQMFCHIVHLIGNPLVIIRPSRREIIFANPLTVAGHFVQAERRDVKPRRHNRPVNHKTPPQVGTGDGSKRTADEISANPFRPPFVPTEKSHFKPRGRGDFTLCVVFVPDLNAPVNALA